MDQTLTCSKFHGCLTNSHMIELSRVSHDEYASVGTQGTNVVIYGVLMSVTNDLLVIEVGERIRGVELREGGM
jgi:hypothetical protein